MNLPQRHIELLSPAKNAQIGITAINCGADAVYIAAEKFGAREDAGNTLPDIQKLVSHAHQYYGRVYIALNTILYDDELREALKLIKELYSLGADGLIIQDTGLLELDLPPIPLIASTQMNNDSLEKILFLQNIGFRRVILPREMILGQIKEIRTKTTVELECFVHGSLCVCYSGQCYLSYALGGRSANRGACAQPCRRSYDLLDENGKILAKNRHLLSLKDLNRANHLQELIQAGVTSFKIEGRLKDQSYVANITSYYRKKLDALIDGKTICKSSSGTTSIDFSPDPCKTFNRGYTDFFLHGKKEQIASLHTPKSLGEKIGSIAKTEKDYFTLTAKHDLKNGDGICFLDHNDVLRGTLVNKVDQGKIYPDKMFCLKEKTLIFRNHDKTFVKILEKTPCRRKIGVSLSLEESPDGFKLVARDDDANTATYAVEAKKNKAKKKSVAESGIKNQLSSLNETIFSCSQIKIEFNDMFFIPLALLNQLRRGVVKNLLEEREKNRPRAHGNILVNSIPYPVNNITYLGNCLNSKAKAFYERHGAKVTELAAENGLEMNGHRVMVCRYCVKKELGFCGKFSDALYLMDEDKRKYPLKFNCQKCVMEVYFLSKT